MFIKLFFRGTDETFSKPLNEEVNGLINKWLGKENKYHGTFSRYCVSSMQGGSMSKDGILSFKDGGYVVVSSDDVQFISALLNGAMMETNGLVKSMKYYKMEMGEFEPYKDSSAVKRKSPLTITDAIQTDGNKSNIEVGSTTGERSDTPLYKKIHNKVVEELG